MKEEQSKLKLTYACLFNFKKLDVATKEVNPKKKRKKNIK